MTKCKSELNNELELNYNTCLTNINSNYNFNTLLLTQTIFKYNINKNQLCNKCNNINICSQYINKTRTKLIKLEHSSSTYKQYNIHNTNTILNIKTIKLNTTSVQLTSNKSKSKNKQLINKLKTITNIPTITLN